MADGTDAAAARLQRVLTTDPGMGILRHADAGYDLAIAAAERDGLRIPMREPLRRPAVERGLIRRSIGTGPPAPRRRAGGAGARAQENALREELVYHPPDFSATILAEAPDAPVEAAPADGIVPRAFYATTNYPTYVKYEGQWRLVQPPAHGRRHRAEPGDRRVRVHRDAQCARRAAGGRSAAPEDGSTGVLVHSNGFRPASGGTAPPMPSASCPPGRRANARSTTAAWPSWSPATATREGRADLGARPRRGPFRRARGDVLADRPRLCRAIFGGNAVATHDIEHALYGTALGMDREGQRYRRRPPAPYGRDQRRARSRLDRRRGRSGPDQERHHVQRGQGRHRFVLAGSIRDDGPLPEVITDALDAQDQMRGYTQQATLVVMLATMLHSIATGNMMPTFVERDGTLRPVYTIAVDAAENVISKLIDRGTHQAIGIVRNADDFLVRLVQNYRSWRPRMAAIRLPALLSCLPRGWGDMSRPAAPPDGCRDYRRRRGLAPASRPAHSSWPARAAARDGHRYILAALAAGARGRRRGTAPRRPARAPASRRALPAGGGGPHGLRAALGRLLRLPQPQA